MCAARQIPSNSSPFRAHRISWRLFLIYFPSELGCAGGIVLKTTYFSEHGLFFLGREKRKIRQEHNRAIRWCNCRAHEWEPYSLPIFPPRLFALLVDAGGTPRSESAGVMCHQARSTPPLPSFCSLRSNCDLHIRFLFPLPIAHCTLRSLISL